MQKNEIVDLIEEGIDRVHDMDVTFRDYAESIYRKLTEHGVITTDGPHNALLVVQDMDGWTHFYTGRFESISEFQRVVHELLPSEAIHLAAADHGRFQSAGFIDRDEISQMFSYDEIQLMITASHNAVRSDQILFTLRDLATNRVKSYVAASQSDPLPKFW